MAAYSLSLGLAALAGLVVAVWSSRRLLLQGRNLWRLLPLLAVAALAGAKLYAVAERGFGQHFSWELTRGYRYPGGLIGLAVAALAVRGSGWSSISAAKVGDLLAPSIGIGTAVSRAGCFLAGCCHGWVSGLPWAVRFPPDSVAWSYHVAKGLIRPDVPASLPVHPLQLYLGVASLASGLAALWWQRRKRYDGEALLLFLALDGITKGVLETFRDPWLWHIQAASLATAAVATAALSAGRWRAAPRTAECRKAATQRTALG